jgi:pyruvate/2-oxoglutarate dehydrogenase complex dihydrolipoamide dehydrogenase (E3) component
MEPRHFDVLVIGAGQAAIPLSFDLAKAGRKVAVAERKALGGSCVNFGCTPTKAAIASARLMHQIRRACEYGLNVERAEPDFAAVMDRARAIAAESRTGLEQQFAAEGAPTLIRGNARFTGRDGKGYCVLVGTDDVIAETVVIDTGTRALVPEVPGLDKVEILTADNWIEMKELPKSLVFLGGGAVALELSQFFRRMGSSVEIVESGPAIGGHEDEDVSNALRHVLEVERIGVHTNAKVERVESTDGRATMFLADGRRIAGECVFVATGRKPNTGDLGVETVGVELDEKGRVKVDDKLRASAPNVFAVGDVRPGPMFTHASWDDYRIVKSQLLGDGSRSTRRVMPYAIFTDPQLGRVGMPEAEARKSGARIGVGRYDVCHNGQARESGLETGFVKVVVDMDSQKLLGAAVLAAEGAEMIQACVDLMNADVPYSVLRDSVVVHPTLMEAVQNAFEAVEEC